MQPLLQALAGWALADLLGGLYHLATDRGWGLRSQVRDFAHHHAHPAELRLLSWHSVGPMLPAAALSPIAWWAPWFGGALCLGLAISQASHWAAHHPRRCWAAVRWLQCARFLLAPEDHARHHRGEHDRSFSILCGWTGPLIDWLVRK